MELLKTATMPDGVALRYGLTRAGRNARGLIVLIHGLASNRTRWSEFVAHTRLKDRWDILRLDLRGHGESFTRGPIGMRLWCEDLATVLDAEQCARAVVIGHSLGAHVALHFAARYPERARAVALIDPVPKQALRGWRRAAARLARPPLALVVAALRLLNALGIRRQRLPALDLYRLDEQMRVGLLVAGRPDEFIRRYASFRGDIKYFPTAHYFQELRAMLAPLPALAEIKAPMLIMLSEGITHTSPEATRRLFGEAPRTEIVTIDAYHWPLTERPEEVQREIERWCGRLE